MKHNASKNVIPKGPFKEYPMIGMMQYTKCDERC